MRRLPGGPTHHQLALRSEDGLNKHAHGTVLLIHLPLSPQGFILDTTKITIAICDTLHD